MTPSFNEKMRQKPKHVRARWAFWSAFLLTILLVVAWLAYIPGKLDRIAKSYEDTEDPQGNFGRVLDSMKASLGDVFNQYREEFASTTGQLASSSPEVASSTDAATTTDPNNIDFTTFFPQMQVDDGSGDVPDEEQYSEEYYEEEMDMEYIPEAEPEPSPAGPRRVLIGTSSGATSTAQ